MQCWNLADYSAAFHYLDLILWGYAWLKQIISNRKGVFAGYLGYAYIQSLGYVRKQKTRRAPKRTAPVAEPTKDEWLKGTHFAQGAPKAPRKSPSKGDVRKASPIRGAIAPEN